MSNDDIYRAIDELESYQFEYMRIEDKIEALRVAVLAILSLITQNRIKQQ